MDRRRGRKATPALKDRFGGRDRTMTTEKPCTCEACASPGETVRMARETANALVVVGRPVDADQMRALLHLLDQRPGRVKELERENAELRGSLDELRIELWVAEHEAETNGESDVVQRALHPHLGTDVIYAGHEGKTPALVAKSLGGVPLTVADVLAAIPGGV